MIFIVFICFVFLVRALHNNFFVQKNKIKKIHSFSLSLYFLSPFPENAEENPKDKPELHYVGNIHGDEVVSRELLLRFIDLLLTTYLSGKEAQNNVIFFCFLFFCFVFLFCFFVLFFCFVFLFCFLIFC